MVLIMALPGMDSRRQRTDSASDKDLMPTDSLRPNQTGQIEATDLWLVYLQALRAKQQRTRRVFLMLRLRCTTYREIADNFCISN